MTTSTTSRESKLRSLNAEVGVTSEASTCGGGRFLCRDDLGRQTNLFEVLDDSHDALRHFVLVNKLRVCDVRRKILESRAVGRLTAAKERVADNIGAVRDIKIGDDRNMGATREARNLDMLARLFLREQPLALRMKRDTYPQDCATPEAAARNGRSVYPIGAA